MGIKYIYIALYSIVQYNRVPEMSHGSMTDDKLWPTQAFEGQYYLFLPHMMKLGLEISTRGDPFNTGTTLIP